MANDNNVSIGSIGTGNTVNIAQHQAPQATYVEYKVAPESVEHLSKGEVNKGVLTFFGSLCLPILALVADALGILSYLGLQTRWALVVLVPIALIGATLTSTKLKIATAKFTPEVANFIDGKWVELEREGNYLIYRRMSPCIYPKCSGMVFIRPAPPREQPNHTLVGMCDTGRYRHTYTVDFNGIGYPAQFDWRPIERPAR